MNTPVSAGRREQDQVLTGDDQNTLEKLPSLELVLEGLRAGTHWRRKHWICLRSEPLGNRETSGPRANSAELLGLGQTGSAAGQRDMPPRTGKSMDETRVHDTPTDGKEIRIQGS